MALRTVVTRGLIIGGWAALGCSSTSSGAVGDGGAHADAEGDEATPNDAQTQLQDAMAGEAGAETEGGVAGDAGLPPLGAGSLVTSLTPSQLGELCDWFAAQLGGYGMVFPCSGGIQFSVPTDQAQCVQYITYMPGCVLTVGQFETCAMARAPSHGCDRPAPQCTPVMRCIPVPANGDP